MIFHLRADRDGDSDQDADMLRLRRGNRIRKVRAGRGETGGVAGGVRRIGRRPNSFFAPFASFIVRVFLRDGIRIFSCLDNLGNHDIIKE